MSSAKTALITGITGQDGSYLARLLLEKGYIVHGIKRRASQFNTQRIDHLYQEPFASNGSFTLHYGDLTDNTSLIRVLEQTRPDEIYNLGAQSHVLVSFDMPEYTENVNFLGAQRLLETLRISGMADRARFYQASSSEMYGNISSDALDENSAFAPCSPYAISKLAAHWTAKMYRDSYDMFVTCGILFNHESPVRAETFVTRKIARAVARIKRGEQECLYLGNLESLRDWGHTEDYVHGMWLMMQHKKPDDFVLATGQQKSVRWVVQYAFSLCGYQIEWKGSGLKETGIDQQSGKVLVRVAQQYFRPLDVHHLLGDASKAKKELGWEPVHTVDQVIEEMVESELRHRG